jgi:hypothetical protein
MDVVSYIDSKESPTREILFHLHQLIIQLHPQMKSKIRFKIPFYDIHSWICYCNPLKKGGVELVFLKGIRIPDPFNLLCSKERKMVKGVTIPSLEEFPEEQVVYYLLEAIGLDESDYLAKK